MSDEIKVQPEVKLDLSSLVAVALAVIKSPTEFFRQMPKSGGFLQPLIFAVVLGVVAGLVRAVLGFVFGDTTFWMAILFVVLAPIFLTIFSFVGAGVGHVIWKIMGSKESYEASYRCGAYSMGVVPLVPLFEWVPYVGSILGIVWFTYLMILAAVEVHDIREQTARLGFGLVGGALALMVVSVEFASNRLTSGFERAWAREGVHEDDIREFGDALDELFSRRQK